MGKNIAKQKANTAPEKRRRGAPGWSHQKSTCFLMSGFLTLGVDSPKKINKLKKKKSRVRCQFYEKEPQATQIFSVHKQKTKS